MAEMRSAEESAKVRCAFSKLRPKVGSVPPPCPPEEAEAQAEEAPPPRAGSEGSQKCRGGL